VIEQQAKKLVVQAGRIVVSAVAVVAATLPVAGQDMDMKVGVQARGSASYLSLNHDASRFAPPPGFPMASYGNPTSILSYEPLYSADIELVVGGEDDAGWFEFI